MLRQERLRRSPDPGDLSTEQMQTITREVNFSECTFIFPAFGRGDIRMRIFTPGEEPPTAGHPTIGSTFALAQQGVIARGRESFMYELGTCCSTAWPRPSRRNRF